MAGGLPSQDSSFPSLKSLLCDHHLLTALLSPPKTLVLYPSTHLPFVRFGFLEFSLLFLLLLLLNDSEDVYLKTSYTSHLKHFLQNTYYE